MEIRFLKNHYRSPWVKDKKRFKNCIPLRPLSCPPVPLPVQRAFNAAELESNALLQVVECELQWSWWWFKRLPTRVMLEKRSVAWSTGAAVWLSIYVTRYSYYWKRISLLVLDWRIQYFKFAFHLLGRTRVHWIYLGRCLLIPRFFVSFSFSLSAH